MAKSRAQLKKYFENGCMPDASEFADLIDAMAMQDEYARFVEQTNAALARKQSCDLGDFPQAPLWMGMGGRIGLYDPSSASAGKMKPASALVTQAVLADGQWHPVVPGLSGCFAFEIVASVSGGSDANAHALTHAIAVTSFSGWPCSIRQTQTYSGFFFWRRISVAWRRNGKNYDLCVKTRRNYGAGSDGQPTMIQFHITRLW